MCNLEALSAHLLAVPLADQARRALADDLALTRLCEGLSEAAAEVSGTELCLTRP
jgi:hypothetical protein